MNKLIKTKVADIMLRHPETQDNDRELIVRYKVRELFNDGKMKFPSFKTTIERA
jgi:hypothetical protein